MAGARASGAGAQATGDACVASFLRATSDVLLVYEAPGLPSLPFDKTIFRKIWRSDSLVPVVGGRNNFV